MAYENYTVKELIEVARSRGIPYSGYRKSELIAKLRRCRESPQDPDCRDQRYRHNRRQEQRLHDLVAERRRQEQRRQEQCRARDIVPEFEDYFAAMNLTNTESKDDVNPSRRHVTFGNDNLASFRSSSPVSHISRHTRSPPSELNESKYSLSAATTTTSPEVSRQQITFGNDNLASFRSSSPVSHLSRRVRSPERQLNVNRGSTRSPSRMRQRSPSIQYFRA